MENYRFFGSAEGDVRSYNQLEFAEVLSKIFTNGHFPGVGNQLAVIQNTPAAMSVKVDTGEGWINGYWYQNDALKTLIIATANLTNPRIDTVVLRLDTVTNRSIGVFVLTGVPSSSPVAPTLTQTAQVYELPLADIAVAASASAILTANITDRRVACNMGIAPSMVASAIGNSAIGLVTATNLQSALGQISTALGNDAAFAATMATALGLRSLKSTILSKTIATASWVADGTFWKYAIPITSAEAGAISTTTKIELVPKERSTFGTAALFKTYMDLIQNANIQGESITATSGGTGYVNIIAMGTKPASNVDITLIVRGD